MKPHNRKCSQRTYRRAIEKVARRYDVPADVLLSFDRHRRIARIRFRAWALLIRCGYSLSSIGRVARRDHSSIYHGVKRLKEGLADIPDEKQVRIRLVKAAGCNNVTRL